MNLSIWGQLWSRLWRRALKAKLVDIEERILGIRAEHGHVLEDIEEVHKMLNETGVALEALRGEAMRPMVEREVPPE